MTATVIDNRLQRALDFYDSTIGKKTVMAVTGAILFGFVLAHMAGNLQVFLGRDAFDAYARLLRAEPALLWAARLILLVSVVLHIVAAVQLTALKQKARPIGYQKKANVDSSYAARTMMWSGPILAAFIVYHLLHFTLGTVHPNFQEGRVYDNVISGFRVIPVSIAYIVAMVLLGMHLDHGVWSMFQSLGVSNPRYSAGLRRFARIFSTLIVLGFISIPIAVMAGYGS
jgi:succinate dehydrogenase / fumarate reductase, cytochrome b subunit